ncbi:hypothetical protein OSB04_014487 [Centaurea solstitialis]|uniref:Uncharacterized protein n=1 Tax=Centaurea solstitialis TaxID=347529 RepID=A0AA38W831_9ASTR|nr:hypothetical protein OSB04_014487 [Centaurea solstitialis]
MIMKSWGKLSTEEENFVMTWKENTIRQVIVGATAGAAIPWSVTLRRDLLFERIVTRNFDNLYRIYVAVGSALFASRWSFNRSITSRIENILCMEGTQMQKDLASLMLQRHPNHPVTRNLIPKHFYCEKVFDESTSDMPKSRWRYRNNFVESAAHPQRTENHESYNHDAKIGPKHKPVPMNNGFVAMETPFDYIFGVPPSVDEIQLPVPAAPSRRHSRRHRRSQRRHQIHDDDDI